VRSLILRIQHVPFVTKDPAKGGELSFQHPPFEIIMIVVAKLLLSVLPRAGCRSPGYVGAVAFSRSGDPATGDFSDAKVIRKFGDVPDDLSAL
jgi:hypothetical protein